jgi:hypothetical protein
MNRTELTALPRFRLMDGDPDFASRLRLAILLVAGDTAGNWEQWYRQAVPRAGQLLEIYLKERAGEEERGG